MSTSAVPSTAKEDTVSLDKTLRMLKHKRGGGLSPEQAVASVQRKHGLVPVAVFRAGPRVIRRYSRAEVVAAAEKAERQKREREELEARVKQQMAAQEKLAPVPAGGIQVQMPLMAPTSITLSPAELKEIAEAVMTPLQRELIHAVSGMQRALLDTLPGVVSMRQGEAIARSMEGVLMERILEGLSESHNRIAAQVAKTMDSAGNTLDKRLDEICETLGKLQQGLQALNRVAGEIRNTAAATQTTVNSSVAATNHALTEARKTMDTAAHTMQATSDRALQVIQVAGADMRASVTGAIEGLRSEFGIAIAG